MGNVSNAAEFASAYTKEIEITTQWRPEPFCVIIRRGISPDSCRAVLPMPNPLLPLVAEKDDKKSPETEKDMKLRAAVGDAVEMMRKAAELALVSPTWAEIGQYIKDDVGVLNQIFGEATGLNLLKLGEGAAKGGTFRPGEAPADTQG